MPISQEPGRKEQVVTALQWRLGYPQAPSSQEAYSEIDNTCNKLCFSIHSFNSPAKQVSVSKPLGPYEKFNSHHFLNTYECNYLR